MVKDMDFNLKKLSLTNKKIYLYRKNIKNLN